MEPIRPARGREADRIRGTLESSYWEGFDYGKEMARRELRDEIANELEAELILPDCPMCRSLRRVAELEQDLAAAKSRMAELRARSRGHAIRNGKRQYRETRAS